MRITGQSAGGVIRMLFGMGRASNFRFELIHIEARSAALPEHATSRHAACLMDEEIGYPAVTKIRPLTDMGATFPAFRVVRYPGMPELRRPQKTMGAVKLTGKLPIPARALFGALQPARYPSKPAAPCDASANFLAQAVRTVR